MYFSKSLTATLLCLASIVNSSPILDTRQTIDPPSLYYLQTKVVNGNHKDCGTDKNNLWLYSHHTGAGLGDGGLSPNKSSAMQAYLNGSQQLFTFEGNEGGSYRLAIQSGPYQRKSTTKSPSCAATANTARMESCHNQSCWLAHHLSRILFQLVRPSAQYYLWRLVGSVLFSQSACVQVG